MDLGLEIKFSQETCRFVEVEGRGTVSETAGPLSVILQVTRRCNFSCVFCSETSPMEDMSFENLRRIRDHLVGVPRVYISGGEPLLRKDLPEVLDLFRDDFIVGLPTNAAILPRITSELAGRVTFVNVGLDGPRSVASRIRGDYDTIIEGVRKFQAVGIPVSLSCVVLGSTRDSVPLTCQIADVLGARKLKLILPIPKGNALTLPKEEYLSPGEAKALFRDIAEQKGKYGWAPTVTMTAWTPEVEGYAILVFPDAQAFAWPVYDRPEHVLDLGNLAEEPISAIWQRYPYKVNHLRKYLGRTILVA